MRRAPPLRTAALAILVALSTCAARRPSASPPPLVAEVALRGATDRLEAIATVEEYLAGDPDPEVEPWAMAMAGEQRRLAGDLAVARTWFDTLGERFPDHPATAAATLGRALASNDGLSGNALATLQLVGDRGVPDTMNADRYRLLARLGADEGTARPKVMAMVRKAVAFAGGDPAVEARVRRDLADLLSEEQAGGLSKEGDEVSAEEAALSGVRRALADRRLDEATATGNTFLSTWPESAHAREVRALVRRAEAGDPTTAGRVGVLLPLSGTYEPAGRNLREAIELAAGGKLDLVWYDTGSGGDKAVAGVDKLVLEKGCVALLGPLLKEDAVPAAEAAQAFGVPMVALSQSGEPTKAGPYVFRGFLTVRQQVDALLDHATGTGGMKRFAVLYPKNPFGEAARDEFGASAERHGATVARSVGYDPDAKDFLKPARELGQKDYKSRGGELGRLRAEAIRKDMDPSKVVLPPTIDFDGIFIPDNWQRSALVASALAYEEFAVGSFRPHRGAVRMPLLGLNAWNNPQIVEAGGAYLDRAVFVDAFRAGSEDMTVGAFVSRFRDENKRAPSVVEAVAYDATRLLATAVMAGGDSRDAIRDELKRARLDDAVAGGERFGDDRELSRRLEVLEIRGGRIAPWAPPEEVLPPEGIEPPGE